MGQDKSEKGSSNTLSVAVLGAGVVGLSCALQLQHAGFKVTLFDSEPAGQGASFGNAGLFADYGRLPFANFAMLKKMPGMLLDKKSPLAIDLSYAPKLLRYGSGYFRACFKGRYLAGRQGLYNLHSIAGAADRAMIEQTGSQDLICAQGFLGLFSSAQSLAKARVGNLAERAQQGVEMQFLNGAEVRDMEPNLQPQFAGAVYYPNTRHTVDPRSYCQRLFEHFIAVGGRFVQQRVCQISSTDESVELRSVLDHYRFDRLVLAAGASSRELLKQLQLDIPQVCERGYHLMLTEQAPQISRPIAWMNQGVHMTPMQQGIRVAGTAEYTHFGSAPSEQRKDVMLAHAHTLLGSSLEVASSWVGSRPTTPDSLPIIANSKRHPRVTLAFGHGHLGLTLAAVTGKMVVQLVSGQVPEVDISAFSAERFN